MNILIWHVHGSWTSAFIRGGHDYTLPLVPGRGADGRGRAATYDWPDNVREVPYDRLRDEPVDVVVHQRPHEIDLLPRFAGRVPLDVFGMKVAGLPYGAYEDLPQHVMHAAPARRRAYLHPYRWTSLGLALVEAMTLGMPVVAPATTKTRRRSRTRRPGGQGRARRRPGPVRIAQVPEGLGPAAGGGMTPEGMGRRDEHDDDAQLVTQGRLPGAGPRTVLPDLGRGPEPLAGRAGQDGVRPMPRTTAVPGVRAGHQAGARSVGRHRPRTAA